MGADWSDLADISAGNKVNKELHILGRLIYCAPQKKDLDKGIHGCSGESDRKKAAVTKQSALKPICPLSQFLKHCFLVNSFVSSLMLREGMETAGRGQRAG